MPKPKLLIYASGTSEGGGSGFENLVHRARDGILDAEIIGVVSNHENGGVRRRADRLKIPFIFFRPPYSHVGYILQVRETGAEFVALSGWLKLAQGLDPATTFNIHPGPLPTFGGKGMHGIHIHHAVLRAHQAGIVTHSQVCMHFVTKKYDEGPCFLRRRVLISKGDTPETLAHRVNDCEHRWQPHTTNLVVHREIRWDGKDPDSLQTPRGFKILSDEIPLTA